MRIPEKRTNTEMHDLKSRFTPMYLVPPRKVLSDGRNLYEGVVIRHIGQLKMTLSTIYSTYLERISRFKPPLIPGF